MIEVLVTIFDVVKDLASLALKIKGGLTVFNWLKKLWGSIREPTEILVPATMTERDNEMADKTRQIVMEIFGQDAAATVEEADYNGRVAMASDLVKKLTEAYGIDLDGCEIYIDSNIKNCGGYLINENKIKLNGAYLFSEDPDLIYEFINTVIHELRHAVQFRSIIDPMVADTWQVSEETREIWKNNLLHYTPPTVDLKEYTFQPVENDARTFARLCLRGWRPEN